MGLRARSLALLHDHVAEVHGEAPSGEGKDEGEQEEPPGGHAEHGAHLADETDGPGLGLPTALSLVGVDTDGIGSVEDGQSEDEPGELG